MNKWIRRLLGLLFIGGAGYASVHYYDRIPGAVEKEAKIIGFFDKAAGSSTAELHSWSRQQEDSRTFARFTSLSKGGDDSQVLPLTLVDIEDTEKIFQTSPPSASDVTTVIHQLAKYDPSTVLLADPLVMENTDPLTKQILQAEVADFSKCILAVDLRRSPTTTDLPSAFSRCSLPRSVVQGDTSLLPEVNRMDLEPLTLGGVNTGVGFRFLGSDEYDRCLVARWSDRIVLHSFIVAFAQQHDVKIEDIQLQVGAHLTIGGFARIPIDSFGRVEPMGIASLSYEQIKASSLITENGELEEKIKDRLTIIGDRSVFKEDSASIHILNACATASVISENFTIGTLEKLLHMGFLILFAFFAVYTFGIAKPKYQLSIFLLAMAFLGLIQLYLVEEQKTSLPLITTAALILSTLIARLLFLKNVTSIEAVTINN